MNPLSPGTRLEDRYEVEALVGRGGQASVYRVRHRSLGSLHAAKVVHGVAARAVDRLMLEGRTQARLRHPNVVAVTDVARVGDEPVLIMEWIEGRTLRSLLEAGPLSLDDVDTIARQILAGVAAAHALRVVHRDLKPENVLLTGAPGAWVAKVTDFGLAAWEDGGEPRLTRDRAVFGTPAYMPPEQFRDARSVGPAGDVFALGAVLFEMLDGAAPFPFTQDLVAAYEASRRGPARSVRSSRPGVPERMAAAVEASLRADPETRPHDAGELLGRWTGRIAPGVQPTATMGGGRTFPPGGSLPEAPLPDAGPAPPAPSPAPKVEPRRSWGPFLGAAAVAIVIGGGVGLGGWWQPPEPSPPPTLRIGFAGALEEDWAKFSGVRRLIHEAIADVLLRERSDGGIEPALVSFESTGPTSGQVRLVGEPWLGPHPCLGPEGRPVTLADVAAVIRAYDDGWLGLTSAAERDGALELAWARPNVFVAKGLEGIPFLLPLPAPCPDTAPLASSGPYALVGEPLTGPVRLERTRTGRPEGPGVIEWIPVPSATDGRADVASGDLDLYVPAPNEPVAEATEVGRRLELRVPVNGVGIGSLPGARGTWSMFRLLVRPTEASPLADKRVRHAFSLAVDRTKIANGAALGAPTGRFLGPELAGYDGRVTEWTHDPARAAALLADAGFPGGAGLPELTLGHSHPREAAARGVADDLSAIGIPVRLVPLSPAQAAVPDEVDLYLGGSGNPVVGVEPLFLSPLAATRDSTWLAPDLAEEARALLGVADRREREKGWARLEAAVLDLALTIPLARGDDDSPWAGILVYYGPRVAHLFDADTGRWRPPRAWDQIVLGEASVEP